MVGVNIYLFLSTNGRKLDNLLQADANEMEMKKNPNILAELLVVVQYRSCICSSLRYLFNLCFTAPAVLIRGAGVSEEHIHAHVCRGFDSHPTESLAGQAFSPCRKGLAKITCDKKARFLDSPNNRYISLPVRYRTHWCSKKID